MPTTNKLEESMQETLEGMKTSVQFIMGERTYHPLEPRKDKLRERDIRNFKEQCEKYRQLRYQFTREGLSVEEYDAEVEALRNQVPFIEIEGEITFKVRGFYNNEKGEPVEETREYGAMNWEEAREKARDDGLVRLEVVFAGKDYPSETGEVE